MSDEIDKSVENFQSGISLKMEVKRGSDTRDQDKIVGKVRGKNMEEIQEYSKDQLEDILNAFPRSSDAHSDALNQFRFYWRVEDEYEEVSIDD